MTNRVFIRNFNIFTLCTIISSALLSLFTFNIVRNQLTPTITYADSVDWAKWKQYEGEWASIETGGGTIQAIGCYIISEAIQARRSGITKINGQDFNTPTVFVNHMKKVGGIVGGGLKALDSMNMVTDGKMKRVHEEFVTGRDNRSKIAYMKTQQDKGYYMIVSVSGQSHWMAVNEVKENQITLFDPGSHNTEFPTPSASGGQHQISTIESVVSYENKDRPVQQADGSSSGGDSDSEAKPEEDTQTSHLIGEDGWKNKMVNFKDNVYHSTFKGLDSESDGFISNAVIVNLNNYSNKAIDYANIFMMVITTATFFLMFLLTIYYLVVLPNGLGGQKLNGIFQKLTNMDGSVNKQNTLKIMGRMGVTTVVIACLYANLIPLMISGILGLLQTFMSIFM